MSDYWDIGGKEYATSSAPPDQYQPWPNKSKKTIAQTRPIVLKRRAIKVTNISPNFGGKLSRALLLAPKEDEFLIAASCWHRETAHLSSLPEITRHSAYQQIIAMGIFALPWILKDLQATSAFWFPALKLIARTDPAANAQGDVRAMTQAWLEWARTENLIEQ